MFVKNVAVSTKKFQIGSRTFPCDDSAVKRIGSVVDLLLFFAASSVDMIDL
jgi:hypothetical protein